jgi:Fur family transcriptional regulator, ferric uptake regulator
MSVPSNAPAVGATSVAHAVNALRARGLRLSSARRVLLEALFAAGRPLTAEELAGGDGGRVPPSDLASVYRNLETLETLGLACHVHLGHGPGRWHPAGAPHEFVICERCDAVQALAPDALHGVRAAVRAAVGYEPRFTHFPLAGLCPACAQEDRDARP